MITPLTLKESKGLNPPPPYSKMVTKHRKWSAASGSRSYPYFLTFLRYGPDFPTKVSSAVKAVQ